MLYTERTKARAIPAGWKQPLKRFELHLIAVGRSPRTVSTRITQLCTAARALGRDTPGEVTRDDLEMWCGAAGWAPETRHAYYSSLRSFYRWLCRDCEEANPASWLPSIHRPVPPPRPAPDDAIREAIAKAPPRTRLILSLAAELGLRANEIACLHTSSLSKPENGWSTLTVLGKGGRSRSLPVHASLRAEIFAQAQGEGWVFAGQVNGHLSARWVSILAGRYLPEPWTLHNLRHRFGTVGYNACGKDLIAVQKALGHQSITTTQRYTQSALELQDLMKTTQL